MRHASSWFLGGALALGLALSAQAQQGEPTAPNWPGQMKEQAQEAFMGQIVAKDDQAETFSIETDAGKKLNFRVSETTQYRAGPGENAQLGDLQIGDRVMVQARPAAADGTDRVATRVQVQPRGLDAGAQRTNPSTPH